MLGKGNGLYSRCSATNEEHCVGVFQLRPPVFPPMYFFFVIVLCLFQERYEILFVNVK